METMFWRKLTEICEQRGTSPTGMCKAIGLSTGNVPAWKRGGLPNQITLGKIADHFSVEPEYFVGAAKNVAEAKATAAQVKFALFDGKEVSDETYQKVLTFAKFAAEEEERLNGGKK